MPHETGLIATITIAFTFAFIGGFLANRLRLPAIVGYLLAGVAIGPYTPGFIADAHLAAQLAEIGVILLMFGVGIHFSLRDLWSVRTIAIPGALAQIAVATALGAGLAHWWGWSPGGALVLGLALSVASTVMLLRSLMEFGVVDSQQGRIAIGWLIVQDVFMVLVLVLLPELARSLGGETTAGLGAAVTGVEGLALSLALALGKTAAFTALMLFVGARAVPWLLIQVAETNSRELFTLVVLVLALGIASASAALFGVSLALGAFLAGVVVSESDLSHQAAAEALPLRDAFAVLFFVSVGMLFDPLFIFTDFGGLVAVLLIILLATPLAAAAIVLSFGYSLRAALTIAAGLAQIGEFSFILAGLGRTLGLLPPDGYHLILGGALLSITLNSFLFRAIEPVEAWIRRHPKLEGVLDRTAGIPAGPTLGAEEHGLRGHAVICGFGRVGGIIGHALERRGLRFLAVDLDRRRVASLRESGIPALFGDAGNPAILEHAGLDHARILVVAATDPIAARRIVETARRAHPRLEIIVRTHSAAERGYLAEHGANEAVIGELELALELARHTLHRFGVSGLELQSSIQGLRRWGEETEPALEP